MKFRGVSEGRFKRVIREAVRQAELGGSAFPDDTPDKKAERLRRAAEDPSYFNVTYLPHYFSGPPADWHAAWAKHLDDFAIPNPKAGAPGTCILCPRGGSKTTVISFAGLLRQAVYDRVKFMVVVSNISALSDEVVEGIADELESNPRLRTDFGDLLKSRAKTKFGANVELKNGVRIQGLSMGGSFRGLKHGPFRPQLAVVDDPETTESVRNPTLREQTRQKLTNELRKAMQPGACIFVVQNMLHADCLSGRIVSDVRQAALAREQGQPLDEFNFRNWTVFVYAIRREDGSSAWPSRFPQLVLDAMEAEDPDGFALEMMNLPVARTGRTFRRELFRFYMPEDLVAAGQLWRVMACDPSLGKTDRSDFSAIVVLGTSDDQRTFCEEADIKRRSPATIVQDLFAHWRLYNPALTIIEGVAFQSLLAESFRELCERYGLYPPLKLYEDNTPKDLRIKRVESPVNRGAIEFAPHQVEMVRQLDLYGTSGVNDDGPDALEMAWSEVQLRRKGVFKSDSIRMGGGSRTFRRRPMGDLGSWREALRWFIALGRQLGHLPAAPASLRRAA